MNNKPFDPTKPCQTRDGRKVRILCTDAQCFGISREPQPIVGLIDGNPTPQTWSKNGGFGCGLGNADLINIPEKRTVWVNMYKSGGTSPQHPSKESADTNASLFDGGRIACIKVEFTEGEGL